MTPVRALFFVLILLSARPLTAQSLLPVKGLDFGVLQTGVSSHVSPDDAGRAIIDVVGSGRLSIRLLPPSAMTSPTGNVLPMDVLAGDALLRLRNGTSYPLIPGETTEINIPGGLAPAVIHVGGTAHPSVEQAPGIYTATIVIQIVSPGT